MQCCQQGHSLHVWRRSGHTPCSAVNKATPCMSGVGQDILHAVLSTRPLLACLAEVRTYSMQCCRQGHSCMSGGGQDIFHAVLSTRTLLHVWRRSGHTPCSVVDKDPPACLAEVRRSGATMQSKELSQTVHIQDLNRQLNISK